MDVPTIVPTPSGIANGLTPNEHFNADKAVQLQTDRLHRDRMASRKISLGIGTCAAVVGILSNGFDLTNGWISRNNVILTGFIAACVVVAILLFIWDSRINDELRSAELLAPPHATRRIGLLETEMIRQRQEIHQLKSDAGSHSRRLEAARSTISEWALFQNMVSALVVGYKRDVNAEIDKRGPRTDQENADLLPSFESRFDDILGSVVKHLGHKRRLLFSHNAQYWFFDIFELRDDDHLYKIKREATPNVVEWNRKWSVYGEHLGPCILHGHGILLNSHPDSRNPDNEDQFQPTDALYFQSVITSPIPAVARRPFNYYGLVCVTSSEYGRLKDHHKYYVNNLAHLLSDLFYTRERAYWKFAGKKLYRNH